MSSFCVDHLFLGVDPTLKKCLFSRATPLRRSNFLFTVYQPQIAFGLEIEMKVVKILRVKGPSKKLLQSAPEIML